MDISYIPMKRGFVCLVAVIDWCTRRVLALADAGSRRAWGLRTFGAEGVAAFYPAADAAIDFPAGPGPGATVAVAQWGDGYGWGVEARAALS